MRADLNTVRLVATRYPELQGLRYVLIGGAFMAASACYLAAGRPGGTTGIIVAVVLAFTLILPGQLLIDRYYRAHFGRVVSEPATTSSLWMPASVAVACTLVSQTFDVSALAGGLLIAAGHALWISIRDWPYRAHHLLGCGAAMVAAIIQFTSPVHARSSGEALGLLLLGAAYVPVGLLDHYILVRTLRRYAVSGTEPAGLKSRQD